MPILGCGVLGAIFIPAFIIVQFTCEIPLVNLRLLQSRNLASGAAVGFGLGVGLYGTI